MILFLLYGYIALLVLFVWLRFISAPRREMESRQDLGACANR